MEAEDTKDKDANQPVKKIIVRQDLQEFFEVVDHQNSLLKCKLAVSGRHNCNKNGVAGTLKYKQICGWHNLERHLVNTHKFPKSRFFKTKKNPLVHGTWKRLQEEVLLKPKRSLDFSSISNSISDQVLNLQENPNDDKFCILCTSYCPPSGTIVGSDEHFLNLLKKSLPGSEGHCHLTRDLFSVFFLRILCDLPSSKCERFLRMENGEKSPDLWFTLCYHCRELVLKAVGIHEHILSLRKDLNRMKLIAKSKVIEEENIEWTWVEREIRDFLLGKVQVPQASGIGNVAPFDRRIPCPSPIDNSSEEEPDEIKTLRSPKKRKLDNINPPYEQIFNQDLSEAVVKMEEEGVDWTTDMEDGLGDPLEQDFEPTGFMENVFDDLGRELEPFGESPSEIVIREDLRKYFEVIDHKKKLLKCKLVGKDKCSGGGGLKGFLKLSKGWHNVERHLIMVHKFSKDQFIQFGKENKLPGAIDRELGEDPVASPSSVRDHDDEDSDWEPNGSKTKRKRGANDENFIRGDLQPYYEVVNYKEKQLKCKLAGENGCTRDGIVEAFRYASKYGWHNFERHLTNVHGVPKDTFVKREYRNVNSANVESNEGKKLRVRPDLQNYFQVVDHQKGTFKCKLFGKNRCQVDGKDNVFRFTSMRGWNNFDRHLQNVHKIPKVVYKNRIKVKCKSEILDETNFEEELEEDYDGDEAGLDDPEEPDYEPTALSDSDSNDENFVEKVTQAPSDSEGKGVHTPSSVKTFQIRSDLRRFYEFVDPEARTFKCKLSSKGRCKNNGKDKVMRYDIRKGWYSFERHLWQVHKLTKTEEEGILQWSASKEEELPDSDIDRPPSPVESEGSGGSIVLDAESPVKVREDLEEFFEVVSERRRTFRCKLRRRQGCAKGGRTGIFKYDKNKGWYNFERHLLRVHKFSKVPVVDEVEGTIRWKVLKKAAEDDEAESECDDVVQDSEIPLKTENNPDEDGDLPAEIKRVNIRLDLQRFFEVVSHRFRTLKCKLAGRDGCERNGKKLVFRHLALNGWANFERHLIRVHKFPKECFIKDRGYVSPSSSPLPERKPFPEILEQGSEQLVQQGRRKKPRLKRSGFFRKVTKPGSRKVEEAALMCQKCPANFKIASALRDHLQVHLISDAIGNKYDCEKCGYPCPSRMAQTSHFNHHHAYEGGAHCTLCEFTAPTLKLVTKHMKEHQLQAEKEKVNGKYLCKHCTKLFPYYKILTKHIRTTHSDLIGVVPYKCEHCEEILASRKALVEHVKQKHEEKSKYFCDICGKGMMHLSKLKRHMNGHLEESKFVCDVCGADFKYKETLKNHILREHPDAPDGSGQSLQEYPCKQCGVQLPSKTLLNRHMKMHARKSGNVCNLCGKVYVTQQSLRRHKEINHSQKQFPCPHCGKPYLHPEYLKIHFKFCKKNPDKKISIHMQGETLNSQLPTAEVDPLGDIDVSQSGMTAQNELVGGTQSGVSESEYQSTQDETRDAIETKYSAGF